MQWKCISNYKQAKEEAKLSSYNAWHMHLYMPTTASYIHAFMNRTCVRIFWRSGNLQILHNIHYTWPATITLLHHSSCYMHSFQVCRYRHRHRPWRFRLCLCGSCCCCCARCLFSEVTSIISRKYFSTTYV